MLKQILSYAAGALTGRWLKRRAKRAAKPTHVIYVTPDQRAAAQLLIEVNDLLGRKTDPATRKIAEAKRANQFNNP